MSLFMLRDNARELGDVHLQSGSHFSQCLDCAKDQKIKNVFLMFSYHKLEANLENL